MTQRIEYSEEMVGNAHPTKTDTLNRFINLITAQGDLLQGSAAATAAKLAIGAANLKLFVNAAGTLAEWAGGIKAIALTRALNAGAADVAYTGVGFKPSVIIFLNILTTQSFGAGVDAITYAYSFYAYNLLSSLTYSSTKSVSLLNVGATAYQQAYVKTFDADGFTLTWTVVGSEASTGNVIAICFR